MEERVARLFEHITRAYDTYEEQLDAVIEHGLASDREQAEFLLEDYDYQYGPSYEDSSDSQLSPTE